MVANLTTNKHEEDDANIPRKFQGLYLNRFSNCKVRTVLNSFDLKIQKNFDENCV